MAPHQQRVVDELAALEARLAALLAFTQGVLYADLPAAERVRLARQAIIMADYAAVLGERIAAFPTVPR